MLQLLGDIGLVVSAIADIAFVATYAIVAKWHRSEYGRLLMFQGVCFGLILGLGSLRLVLGSTYSFDVLRTVIFLGVPVIMIWQLILLIRVQVFSRKEARDKREAVQNGDTVPGLISENKNI